MRNLTVLTFLAALLLAGSVAQAGSIDLNDFFADPTVTVSAAGDTATMAEDANLVVVLLSNDPGLGDPLVILASAGILTFDWSFTLGATNDDEFFAFLLEDGLYVGPAYEAYTNVTASGSENWDISGFTGVLGLQFELGSYDSVYDSTATVSNVSTGVVVPLPGAVWMGLGLIGAIGAVRRIRRRR